MKTSEKIPSVYESFNARLLSSEELAKSFIPSQGFTKVVQPMHTLVIGPRGSGKTCLLKMLQPRALAFWSGAEAKLYKDKINYVGVYVPTDISWAQQLSNLGVGNLSTRQKQALEWSVVTVHVLHSLIGALIDRREVGAAAGGLTQIRLSESAEIALVTELAKRWVFPEIAPTLLSLKHALLGRSNDLWLAATQAHLTQVPLHQMLSLSLDFLHELPLAVEVINDHLSMPDLRWAILIDELEIAPLWMVERLVAAMRSIDQRIILKLSASPYTDVKALLGSTAPRVGQDYEVVRLWYEYKAEGRAFCERLFRMILKRNGVENPDPDRILGSSLLKGAEDERGASYRVGSANHKLLLEAYNTDASFKSYCDIKSIDLSNLDTLSEGKRASLIRKIVPTLAVRVAFRKADSPFDGRVRKRSRKKASEVYSGADTFFEMLEGNPRWLLGILSDLVPVILRDGSVSRGMQLDYIERTAERFTALLQTIPLGARGLSGNELSLLDAIKTIAETIYRSAVVDEFRTEPYGIIKIDSRLPVHVHDALGAAINAGALIPQFLDDNDLLNTKLRGKHVRLAYLLSSIYHLPVRIGRHIAASTALRPLISTPEQPSTEVQPTQPAKNHQMEFRI